MGIKGILEQLKQAHFQKSRQEQVEQQRMMGAQQEAQHQAQLDEMLATAVEKVNATEDDIEKLLVTVSSLSVCDDAADDPPEA